jgi:ABC-2 type transport system ATP-binding protein
MAGVPCSDRGPEETAVRVAGLRKRYGGVEAVRGISFEAAPGQIFGLLGPNGAGKTTTLECILGLRQADEGSIQVCGLNPRTHATQAKRLVGAQLQGAALQDRITPREALDLFGSFYAASFAGEELLERFDLEDKADAAFCTLSGGQKQRLFLALALIHRPRLLVLDEPTAGLDPHARRELRSLIAALRDEGRTVLLSTHDLEEAERLCDRVAILDGGRIVAEGPPAELIGRARTLSQVMVRTAPPLPQAMVESLPALAGAIYKDDAWILQTRTPAQLLGDIVRCADEFGAELLDVEFRRPSLEDVLIELTERVGGPA